MRAQKRSEEFDDIPGCSWIDFQSNHTRVLIKWKNGPITEMLVESDQDSSLSDRPLQYLVIVGAGVPPLGCPENIVTFSSQSLCNFKSKHLIEVKAERFKH